jgi:hypothetical protein
MQGEGTSAGLTHQFHAIAFEENLSLRQLTGVFASARLSAHELYLPIEPTGGIYVYPFGAMVTCDVPPERREAELARLRAAQPKLTTQVVGEDYSVIAQAGTPTRRSSVGSMRCSTSAIRISRLLMAATYESQTSGPHDRGTAEGHDVGTGLSWSIQ